MAAERSAEPTADSEDSMTGAECGQAIDELARYRLLARYARDIILVVRADGRIVEANDAALDAYGYARDELLSRTVFDLRAEETLPDVHAQMDQAEEHGLLFETVHRRADGTTFPVEVSSTGAIIGDERVLVSIIRDVTERKRAEEALRESEERFREAVEGLLDPFVLGTPVYDDAGAVIDFRIGYANDPALEFLDTSREEFVGGRLLEVFPLMRDLGLFAIFARVAETGEPFAVDAVSFEQTVRGKRPGHTIDLRVSRVHGSRVVASWRDAAERAQAERDLEAERSRLQTVLATLPVGVVIADAYGRFLSVNETARKIWGGDLGITTNVDEYDKYRGYNPDTGERFRAEDWALARVLKTGEAIVGEVIDIERLDGTRGTILNSAAPFRDDRGRIVGGVVTIQDITDMRVVHEELRRSRDLLESIIDNTPAAIYVKETDGSIIVANKALADLFGRPKEELIGKTSFDLYPREAAEEHTANDREIIERGEPVSFEEIAPLDGEVRTFLSVKFPLKDAEGHVHGIGGVSTDITDRVRAEEEILEAERDLSRAQAVAKTGSWRLDTTHNELIWSDETHRIFAVPKDAPLTYETFLACVHPDDREYVDEAWQAAIKGEPYDIEHRICAEGTIKWVRETAELDFDDAGNLTGGFGTVADITDRKEIELALDRDRKRRAVLDSVAQAGVSSLDMNEVLGQHAVIAREAMNSHSSHIMVLDEETGELVTRAGCNVALPRGFRAPSIGGFVGTVFSARKTVYVADAQTDPMIIYEHVKEGDVRSLLGTPLMIGDRALGILYVDTLEVREFTPDEVALLEAIAARISPAIENAHLFDEVQRGREEVGRQLMLLQRAMAPTQLHRVAGYRSAAIYLPGVEGTQIGGDFYDVFRTESGCIGVLIGDVSGKGLEAASMAAATRSTLRAFAFDLSSAADALTHANLVMAAQQPEDDSLLFVTAFLLILDPQSGAMSYGSAGHPPAAIYRTATREVEFLEFGNPPIGIMERVSYVAGCAQVDPGDRLVLYTDGLSEARRASDGEMFETPGIEAVLREHGGAEPNVIAEALVAAAREWTAGRLSDDTAVLVIARA